MTHSVRKQTSSQADAESAPDQAWPGSSAVSSMAIRGTVTLQRRTLFLTEGVGVEKRLPTAHCPVNKQIVPPHTISSEVITIYDSSWILKWSQYCMHL